MATKRHKARAKGRQTETKMKGGGGSHGRPAQPRKMGTEPEVDKLRPKHEAFPKIDITDYERREWERFRAEVMLSLLMAYFVEASLALSASVSTAALPVLHVVTDHQASDRFSSVLRILAQHCF
jgi:hypothetical protein